MMDDALFGEMSHVLKWWSVVVLGTFHTSDKVMSTKDEWTAVKPDNKTRNQLTIKNKLL